MDKGAADQSELPRQRHVGIPALRSLVDVVVAVVPPEAHCDRERSADVAEQSEELVDEGVCGDQSVTALVHADGQQVVDAAANNARSHHEQQPAERARRAPKEPGEQHIVGNRKEDDEGDHRVLSVQLADHRMGRKDDLSSADVWLVLQVAGKVLVSPGNRPLPLPQVQLLSVQRPNGRW